MPDTNSISRRGFVKASATWAAAVGAFGDGRFGRAADPPARWPVAIRDNLLKVTGQPDCWVAKKALGAEGLEVEVNEEMLCYSLFHPDRKYTLASGDGVRALKEDLAANRAAITAFCMHNRLEERLEQELAWTRQLVAVAQQLEVAVIRIDVAPRKLAADEFLAFAIKACRRMCEVAEGTPVRFGIENHGKVTNAPAFLDRLFDGVGSARLGLTLDAMNFYWFGHALDDLYGIYRKFAPRAFHTHCKNLRYPAEQRNAPRPMGWEYGKHAAPVYEGDIDYQRVVEILRRAGYRGDLCLENECLGHYPKEQQPGVLKKEIATLKDLVSR